MSDQNKTEYNAPSYPLMSSAQFDKLFYGNVEHVEEAPLQEAEENPFFEQVKADIAEYIFSKRSSLEGNERMKQVRQEQILRKVDADLVGYIKESDSKAELKEIFAYIKENVDDEAMQTIRQNNEVRHTVWENMRRINAEKKRQRELNDRFKEKLRETFGNKKELNSMEKDATTSKEADEATPGIVANNIISQEPQVQATTEASQSDQISIETPFNESPVSQQNLASAETEASQDQPISQITLEPVGDSKEGKKGAFDPAIAENSFGQMGNLAAEQADYDTVNQTTEMPKVGTDNDSNGDPILTIQKEPASSESQAEQTVMSKSEVAKEAIEDAATSEAEQTMEDSKRPTAVAVFKEGQLISEEESKSDVVAGKGISAPVGTSHGHEVINEIKNRIRSNDEKTQHTSRPDFFGPNQHQQSVSQEHFGGNDGVRSEERTQFDKAVSDSESALTIKPQEDKETAQLPELVEQKPIENQESEIAASGAILTQTPENQTEIEQGAGNNVIDIRPQIQNAPERKGFFARLFGGGNQLTTDFFQGEEDAAVLRAQKGDEQLNKAA